MTTSAISPGRTGLPCEMIMLTAGISAVRSPDGIATAPFWVEPLLAGTRDGEPTAMRATLDPGVRTHWHSHPRGQILFVLSGVGQAQRRGGVVVEIRSGDAIWFAAGEVHWHGAAEGSLLSYLSVQALEHGTAVHWLEPVR